MSKIKFGAGVADARNKLGGHVFSKNRFGALLRLKVSPAQPRTPAQNAVRASFTNFAKAWGSALTDAQRAAWIALAAANPIPDQFGDPQIVTGLNMYMRVNRNLHTIGAARLDNAPGDQSVTGLASVTLTATTVGPALSVAFTATPLGASEHLVVVASPCVSAGKNFLTPLMKLVLADPAGATASPQTILTPWTGLFGALIAGAKIGISAYVINDTNGAASSALSTSAVVV